MAQLTADQSSKLESWMVKSPVEATLGQTWRPLSTVDAGDLGHPYSNGLLLEVAPVSWSSRSLKQDGQLWASLQ